ncbi:hypothetical protein GCM10020000_29210 [Streptomyces olivoverticillatus]
MAARRLSADRGRADDARQEPGRLLRPHRAGGLRAVQPGAGRRPVAGQDAAGQLFSYPDTHRYRIGPNYTQLPPNRPHSPVNSYAKDGPMRYELANTARPYAPNSYGGPAAATGRFGEIAGWEASGEMVREAYKLHREDDDWGQPGTMVRHVLDDEARERLVGNVSGHLRNGVS